MQTKSILQALYLQQKHAARIINFKDKFTSAKLLPEQINAMTMYEMNILQTLWFMYLFKSGNTSSIFKHIYTLKPINKHTRIYKNVLLKSLCKKNFAKCKFNCRGPHLLNEFITSNIDRSKAVIINIFKIRLKNIIFASNNTL